jgi:hypothetical protein
MLVAELETCEPFRTEQEPQRSFGVSAGAAKSAAASKTNIHADVFGAHWSPLLAPKIDGRFFGSS